MDVQILQEANEISSLHYMGDYNSIVLKSPMDVGKVNLFQMDIPTAGSPVACKPYPILLKYKEFIERKYRYWKMQDAYLKD